MKRFTTIIFFMAVSFICSFGATSGDSISMKKVFGSYQFYQKDRRLNMNQLVKAMEFNKQAYTMIKSAQSNNAFASIIGGIGGFMVGWPIGTSLGGGDPNWTMAGIGAGLIIVSIPISLSVTKKAKHAIDIYNGGLQSSFLHKSELRFSMIKNGIGLTFRF